MRKLYITYSDRHLQIHSSQPDRRIFLPGAQRTLASASIKMKVSGKDEERKKKEREVGTWTRFVMSAGETLHMGMIGGGEGGYRVYLAMRGGFPEIPSYLGSKNMSLGLEGIRYVVLCFVLVFISLHAY